MKSNHLFRCIAALAVMGCVLTGCGASSGSVPNTPNTPSVPSVPSTPSDPSSSYVVDESANTITATDNSWTISVDKTASSSVITETYTDAVGNLESAPISAYTILKDSVTANSDGSKLLTRLIAVSEEDVENGLDALILAALPEKDGTFYAVLGYEYDAAGELTRAWMCDTDETLKYIYSVANSTWTYDSAETDNVFLSKFHALFTTLNEDLQGFLQEQQLAVEKAVADAEQLVEVALPGLGNGDGSSSKPDSGNGGDATQPDNGDDSSKPDSGNGGDATQPDNGDDSSSKPDNGGETTPTVSVVDSGNCGDTVTWTLTDDGLLTISGTGKTNDYNYQNPAPWHDNYNKQITAVKVESGVTYLGDQLFISLLTLKDVEIADTVTELGSHVFAHCIALETLVLPDHITTTGKDVLLGCKSLTDITLPAELTRLSAYFFGSCTSLTRVTIPLSVTYIDEDAFNGTTALTDVYYYTDDIDNWDAIPGSDCEDLTRVTVHYNGCTHK